jgi:hypothetical protein
MASGINTLKPSSERVPKKQTLKKSTIYSYESKCRSAIKRHAESLKDDPERLTTDFLVEITGCHCKRRSK